MKPKELKTRKQLLEEHIADPAVRERWEETALARAVALRIVAYRVEHGLSQAALAEELGWKQPAVARLETGEKNPTWTTLSHLTRVLGIEFLVDIAPRRGRRLVGREAQRAEVIEKVETGTTRIVVAAD